MNEVRDTVVVLGALLFVLSCIAVLRPGTASITGDISFLRADDDINRISFYEYFVDTQDLSLLNYARTTKLQEKNCGWMGCPNCLLNTCFTGSIFKMDEHNGRVWIANYDIDFNTLRKHAYCYMFIDEEKLITHEGFYDIVFERPIASHGWQANPKAKEAKEWTGWRLYSWRNISAPPLECLSSGIIEKWQAVPSTRAEATAEAKQRQKEREEKTLGKKRQAGEFVPVSQIDAPEPKEEDFMNDMINDLNVAQG